MLSNIPTSSSWVEGLAKLVLNLRKIRVSLSVSLETLSQIHNQTSNMDTVKPSMNKGMLCSPCVRLVPLVKPVLGRLFPRQLVMCNSYCRFSPHWNQLKSIILYCQGRVQYLVRLNKARQRCLKAPVSTSSASS